MMLDSVELVTGVSITIITPALVEVLKQLGLPVKYAGLAAMCCAVMLMVLGGAARGEAFSLTSIATWVLAGVVYGLAAAGLYSQTRAG